MGPDEDVFIRFPVATVVPSCIPKEPLLLHGLEAGEEDSIAETFFQEAETVPSGHASYADLGELVAAVGPHGFVLAFKHFRYLEADDEGVERSGDDGLDGSGQETGSEGGCG